MPTIVLKLFAGQGTQTVTYWTYILGLSLWSSFDLFNTTKHFNPTKTERTETNPTNLSLT